MPVLGIHTDPVGYVYTEKAGLVDLGHVRDMADMTRWISTALTGGALRLVLAEGEAEVLSPPAAGADTIALAASIAYVESWAHELATWDRENFSSFSPEDIPSNIIGIEVGKRALTAGGAYPSAVDNVLAAVLTELGARSKTNTEAVLTKVRSSGGVTRWYTTGTPPARPPELRRRTVACRDVLRHSRVHRMVDPSSVRAGVRTVHLHAVG